LGSGDIPFGRSKTLAVPRQELVAIFRPVVRGYLLAVGCYYCIIAAQHPLYEQGHALWILTSLAGLAAVTCLAFGWMMTQEKVGPLGVEAAALNANVFLLANVVASQVLHFDERKLVYFVIMALCFATAGPTRRITYPSVAAALTCLILMAPPELREEYGFLGLASAFGAIGMSALMRGAVVRELRARLAAEALNRQIEEELARNNQLRLHAQELARREQAANRTKSEFLATITHELRTPLNGVLGMAQVMALSELDSVQRERLDTIQSSGRALLATINDVLDISKIEAGRLEIVAAPFDLDRLIQDLVALYGGLAADKGLAFDLQIEPGAGGWRMGDEVRLRQVFANLLSNALKFTERGGVSVRITHEFGRTRFSVADTGIGLSAGQAPDVFQKFVQVDASTTRKFGGAGLGLAICKELVELMQGRISYTSLPSEGSCFVFEIPLAATGEVVEQPGLQRTSGLSRPVRVLVADDNPMNCIVVQTLLSQFDIASEAVGSGAEAVRAWEAGGWDVILMDIHMPDMDGLTATQEIRARQRSGGWPHVPIVALTASVLNHETEAYFAAGMDDYVAKPIELARLMAVLRAVIGEPGAAEIAKAV
jgi:signal transduction histidine kinase/ActR/RegA family two-component response regulator